MLVFVAARAHVRAAEAPLPLDKTLASVFETKPGKPWVIPSGQSLASLYLAAPSGHVWDLRPYRKLSVKVERAAPAGMSAQLRWLVYSRVGGLYLSPPTPLPLSSVGTVALNLGELELAPVGHQRPWDALAAGEVTAVEFRAECVANVLKTGNDTLQLKLSALTLEAGAASGAKPQLLDLRLSSAPPNSRAVATLSFRIDPLPADPYAPTGAGDVRVKLPSGAQALAFLDQEFVDSNDGAAVRPLAVGAPVWRAFLPEWDGAGAIELVSGSNTWKIPCSAMTLEAPPAAKPQTTGTQAEPTSPSIPFANREPKALAHLRWDTPLEASAPSLESDWTGTGALWKLAPEGDWMPFDAASLAQFFASKRSPSVQPNATTLGPIWRPVPFWNITWGGYGGARRPDSALARRMDELLEAAALDGDVRPLAILDGNALDRQGVFNWASHPLRGALSGPGEIFRTEEGFDFCARWTRYCVARYAHSKAVNALWITTSLNAPGASDFHARLAYLLRDWTRNSAAPVIAFHPLARPPKIVKDVDTFDEDLRRRQSGWIVDTRFTRARGGMVEGSGLDGSRCYELRANDASVVDIAAQKRYDMEFSSYRTPASDDFFACDALMFEVWVPPDAPHDLRVGVHLRDRDGQWYQTLLPGMIRPGDWTTFALDISAANTHGLTPLNHRKIWTAYTRQRLQEIGLHVYSTHPRWSAGNGRMQNLTARFDNIRGVKFPQSFAPPKTEIALYNPYAQPAAQAAHVQDLAPAAPHPNSKQYERGALVEYHVKINRAFANPYDPRDCDLTAIVKTPSGKTVRVPAFFNQLCQRREETPGGAEIVEPIGDEFFTVRYRAQEAGPHALSFELRTGGDYKRDKEWVADDLFTHDGQGQIAIGRNWPWTQYARRYADGRRLVEKVTFVPGAVAATLDLGASAFTVVESAKPFHGFVRVAKDKRHFEFDDGTFFYPIGPCLRSPSDTRIPYPSPKFSNFEIERMGKRGTYQFDEYFDAFAKAGINWGRMWMCSWWGALEWRRDWPGYQGLGRYNLLNAWRVDYILDEAERKNIYLNLAVTNHGQFTLMIDTEWDNNPYNSQLGGPIVMPAEIFTNGDAKIAHQNKLRYIAARYGHSPAVLAFALFSEIEFTEEYQRYIQIPHGRRGESQPDLPAPNVESWHREMAGFLKSIDPNHHLVSTHFSHPTRGESTLMVPEVDIATSNSYSMFEEWGDGIGDASSALAQFWEGNGEGGQVHGFHIFNKPALVEEQGRNWMGNNSKQDLEADLHAGLWGSICTPLSGATGYWWWLHVHLENRYSEYSALVKFVANEDFRAIGDEKMLEPVYVGRLKNTPLSGRAMRSDRRVYAWIFNYQMPYAQDGMEITQNASIAISNLLPGKYTVEFWDTYKGVPTGTQEIEVTKVKPRAEIKLPPVLHDLAFKLKPVEK
ncbi:MAG TPA: hypothetical protein VKX17_27005 [Planctomycetota bacterium]|nr:hypothetical protein [Planctomycetota bacterium]